MAVNFAQFLSGIPSPVDRLEEGVLSGQNQQLNTQKIEQNDVILENQRAQQQAGQAAAQKKAALDAELVALSQNPNRTAKDMQDIIIRNPGLAESFKAPLAQMNNEQRQVSLNEAVNVKAALATGNTDKALQILEDRKEAALNSGDQQEADKSDIMIKTITANPESAGAMIDMFIAANDPDRFAEVSGELSEQRAKRDLAPLELEKAEVDIDKIKADVEKTTADTKKVFAELATVGEADPEKRFDQEAKLRGEFIKGSGDFIKVRDAFKRIEASAKDPSAAGDLALIFNYMKVLDPGSTVREGEFATAQNSAGVTGRVRSLYNNVVDGTRLNENQRADFVGRAEGLFGAQSESHKSFVNEYKRLGKQYKLDPSNIVIELDEVGDVIEEETNAQIPSKVIQNGNVFERQSDGTMKFMGKE